MSVTISDLAVLLQNISISAEPAAGLDELKTVLSTLRLDHLQNAGGQLNLRILFDCLNSSNKGQVETCVDVLGRLLEASAPGANLHNYAVELERALRHPSDAARVMVIKQVGRCVADPEAVHLLSQHTGLLCRVIECIDSDSTAVAAAAVRVVGALGAADAASARLLLTAPLLDALRAAMQSNDTVRYRVYEVAVGVARSAPQSLLLAHEAGLLPALAAEAFGQDILVLLNALELLTTLAESNHGMEYLETNGVTDRLEKMLVSPEDSTLADYTLPGVLRFFGRLGRERPRHVLQRYGGFAARLLTLAGGDEQAPALRTAALDTLACLALTGDGKLALHERGDAMLQCVSAVGRLIQSAPTDLRLRALQTTCQLLHTEPAQQTPQLAALTEAWFTALSNQPLDLLWGIARQPFPDLRLAALHVLAAVLLLPWGQQLCTQRAGFIEYLLDRDTESTQPGREAKLALVTAVLECPGASQRVPADTWTQLTTYQAQGALYVRAHTEIALDDA